MPVYSIYAGASGSSFSTVDGAPFGTVVGYSGSNPLRVFSDDDDTTYATVVGSADDPLGQALLALFQSVTKTGSGTAGRNQLIPTNATNVVVDFWVRVKASSQSGCSDTTFTVEVWAGSAGQRQIGTLTIPAADYTWMSINIPTPGSDPTVPWTAGPSAGTGRFGLRSRLTCGSGNGLPKGAQWSEAHIDVAFTLPAPIFTVQTPYNLSARTVRLQAIVNPNQIFQDTGSDNTTIPPAFPIDYGFVYSQDNRFPDPPIFEVWNLDLQGEPTTDVTIVSSPLPVLPGTTYFYKVASRDKDGNLNYSDVSTFTTPNADRTQGVY